MSFLKCRQLLGCNFADLLKIANERGLNPADVTEAIERAADRKEAYLYLHQAGLNMPELGRLTGMTKQAVDWHIKQIYKGPLRRNDDKPKPPPIKDIRLDFWRLVTANPAQYYGPKGRIKNLESVRFLVERGYRYKQAEAAAARLVAPKPQIVIAVSLGLTTKAEQKTWLQGQLKEYTLKEIYERLMARSRLKFHLMTLHRYATGQLKITIPVHKKRGIR